MTRHSWPDWDVYVHDRAACVYSGLDGKTAAVERLPADAALEDVIDRLLFLHKAQIGLAQADAGQVTPHGEVKKRLGPSPDWLDRSCN